MIKLLIKGTPMQAIDAAFNNGINVLHLINTNTAGIVPNTIAETEDSYSDEVYKWFDSDSYIGAPFPIGSLLWFKTEEKA